MSTAVHGAQVVGGMQENHTTRVKCRWVYGLDHNGDRGEGGKGAEEQNFPRLTAFRGARSVHVLDCPCPGMVLTVCSRAALRHDTVSPTHLRTTQGQQRQQKVQTGREASWLKEVRKVKRVE
jgi:hypothetical protein